MQHTLSAIQSKPFTAPILKEIIEESGIKEKQPLLDKVENVGQSVDRVLENYYGACRVESWLRSWPQEGIIARVQHVVYRALEAIKGAVGTLLCRPLSDWQIAESKLAPFTKCDTIQAGGAVLSKLATKWLEEQKANQLIKAIYRDDLDGIRNLLKQGADPFFETEYYTTPMFSAAIRGGDKAAETVKLLLDGRDPVTSSTGRRGSPLFAAISMNSSLKMIETLIDGGYDVNSRDKDNNETPLHYAVFPSKANIEVIKLLLDKGADPNAFDHVYEGPLDRAASQRKEDIVDLLLERGAEINSFDDWGLTPLLKASMRYNHFKAMEILINRGAEVNVVGKRLGETPLHRCAGRGDVEGIKLLLEHGAKVDVLDNKGKTPADWARDHEARVLDDKEKTSADRARAKEAKEALEVKEPLRLEKDWELFPRLWA